MKLCGLKKILLFIVAACIFSVIIFSGTVVAVEQNHNHTEKNERCIPCLKIEAVNIFLKTFNIIALLSFFVIPVVFWSQIFQKYTKFDISSFSLISLKVRHNT